jgi:SAM-dependent methyltransferase
VREIRERDLAKAAVFGEPSYVWRDGQERRLRLIQDAAGPRASGCVLDNGCGVGVYLERLAASSARAHGVEFDFSRSAEAWSRVSRAAPGRGLVVQARAEHLPYASGAFDLVLSHEVLEHVPDDRGAVEEILRVLRPGGRLVLFAPNQGYPFETHGVYWRGSYRFGNIPLVNYLPASLRRRLAPHVRAYSRRQLGSLFTGLPARFISQGVVFGAYDNLIARWPRLGRILRLVLQSLERTPLRILGLSHFWVVEKIAPSSTPPSNRQSVLPARESPSGIPGQQCFLDPSTRPIVHNPLRWALDGETLPRVPAHDQGERG